MLSYGVAENNFIYFFIGTTAELLKLFPVIAEFEKRKVKFKIIASGQSEVKFNEASFWLKKKAPDILLPSKSRHSSPFLFVLWAMKTIILAPILLYRELSGRPKSKIYFIVHGDTVSSLIGALTAKILGLKVVHIESGLRSFDFFEPFPEEICRVVVSRLADIHFCPNIWSLRNLRQVRGVKINTFQNTFSESFFLALQQTPSLKAKKVASGKYFILVLHRQEHIFFNRHESKNVVEFILKNKPVGLKCLIIKHATTEKFLQSIKGEYLALPRLPYIDFVYLLKKAEFIATDGGGNQEEAYYLGKPCLILRNRTERIEGLGENAILAKGSTRIIKSFLKNYKIYQRKMVRLKVWPSKIITDEISAR